MAIQKGKLNLIEIAKLAGTSKSTVSRVLRNEPHVSPEVRARVEHIITAHDYQPNIFARALTGARTGLIGVLGRWLESGFAAEVIRGMNDEVDRHGCRLMCSFAPGIEEFIRLWKMFSRGGHVVDGVILVAPPMDLYNEAVQSDDRPVILCASRPARSAAAGWDKVDFVALDNETAMLGLVDHLARRGYRKLVHLAGPPDTFDTKERIRSFRKGVAAHRGMSGVEVQGAWTRELGRSVTRDYLHTHERPDAFLAFNDPIALGVLDAVRERGLAVPEEVGVTGWDDVPFCECAGLTTIHQPMTKIGEECARLLFERLEDKQRAVRRTVVMEMPVVARTTTGG